MTGPTGELPGGLPPTELIGGTDTLLARRKLLIGGGAIVLGVGLVGYSFLGDQDTSQDPDQGLGDQADAPTFDDVESLPGGEFDLLSRQDWSMPGVTRTEQGSLRVSYVGRRIVAQDGSELDDTQGGNNPPIGVFGPALRVSGDFSIRAKVSNASGGSALSLYPRTLPVVLDEERLGNPGVRVSLEENLWAGLTGDSLQAEEYLEDQVADSVNPLANDTTEITITRTGDVLRIEATGQTQGDAGAIEISDHGIFGEGAEPVPVWFGFDAEDAESGFTIDEFVVSGNVEIISPASIEVVEDPEGFRALAREAGITVPIGAAVAPNQLVSDGAYAEKLLGWFNSWTAENFMKMQNLQPQPGVFTFEEADAMFALAQRHGITIHGHTLVWGEANPAWVNEAAAGDQQRLFEIKLEHLRTVMSHFQEKYPGVMTSIDVFNEMDVTEFSDEQIAQFFIAAKEIAPDVDLYWNEYGLEGSRGDDDEARQRRAEIVERIIRLKTEHNAPIDGVGFQGHVYQSGDEILFDEFQTVTEELAAHGISYRISEIDVLPDDPSLQASQYREAMQRAISDPNCRGITFWGPANRYNRWRDDQGVLQQGHDFIFDTDLQPIPATTEMQNVLRDAA